MSNIKVFGVTHSLTNRKESYMGSNLTAHTLIASHYATPQFTMTAVSPRPDSETGTYASDPAARHRRW